MFKAHINKLPVNVQKKNILYVNAYYSLKSVKEIEVEFVRISLKATTSKHFWCKKKVPVANKVKMYIYMPSLSFKPITKSL